MTTPPTCIACSIFRREIEALQAVSPLNMRVHYLNSMLHMVPRQLEAKLTDILRDEKGQGHEVMLAYGDCCARMLEMQTEAGVTRTQGINCCEIILGNDHYRALRKEGAFFFLPEWAQRWQEIFEKELGLNATNAQDLMRDMHSRLIYLDTGLVPIPTREMQAASEYTGLPWEAMAVNLKTLRSALEQALPPSVPMVESFQKTRSRDTAAAQFLVFDILENLVKLSEHPGRLGTYLAQQVRELVGARIVAILRPLGDGPDHDHALLAIEPQRHGTPDTLAMLQKLAHWAHEETSSILWQGPNTPKTIQALLDSAGFNGAMILPLRVGTRPVGMVVVVHLLDMQRNEETLRALEILTPVAALVIQNAIFYESQEAVILARTRDLRESEMRHRTILQTALDGFWLVDLEGRLLEVNETYCRMSGYSEHELLTMHISNLEANESAEDTAAHIRTVLELGDMRFESNHRRKDGSLFEVEVRVQFQPTEGGRIVAFLRDITERNRALQITQELQAQLLQSQKMESLGTLAGGVAHDMNNVLGAILGLASANVDALPPGSPIQRALETIINAAERGGKMIKSLLSFARQSPEEIQVLNLNDILQEEVRMLERTTFAKVELTMDLATNLRPIRGDANALTHAFMNLCVNAVDAMPANGNLTLRTRNVDQTWVEVLVEDNGSGMTPEVLAKAMDPFFTTKETGRGTGLGLSMVYSTVMAHRGQMDIQSAPGQGTRVRMRFPACEAQVIPSAQVDSLQNEPAPGGLQILVVDDDDLIQSSMLAILEALGHHATGVYSGEEALAKLEASFQPQVVILDMNMPGLGGAGTLPRLRALNPTVPVLLATGRVDQFALEVAAAYPFVSLLSKPFSMGDLKQRLAEYGND